MKKILLLLVLFVGSAMLSGCTLTETSEERSRRIGLINDLQLRMMVEDWDYLWLYERNTQTTQWHPWVGI